MRSSCVPATEPFLVFTRKFNELRIPYMVSGSVAAIYYGEPRLTNDIDIVLFLQAADVPRLEAAFPPEQFYCPPPEVMRTELERPQRGHFNLIHQDTGFKADLYLSGKDPLHQWGISKARKVDLQGDHLVLAPPEYVILRKLQFYREGGSTKHLRDIHRMLAVLGVEWDRSDLEGQIRRLSLEPEWKSAREYSDA